MMTPDNANACRWFADARQRVTDRFTLRSLSLDDHVAFHAAMENPRISKWLGSFEQPFTLDAAKRWLQSRLQRQTDGLAVYYGIYRHGSGDLLGFVGLYANPDYGMPELVWALAEQAWGKFVIDEVGPALLDDLRRAGVTRACATAATDNAASARLMKVMGLVYDSDCVFKRPDGTERPSHFYVVTL